MLVVITANLLDTINLTSLISVSPKIYQSFTNIFNEWYYFTSENKIITHAFKTFENILNSYFHLQSVLLSSNDEKWCHTKYMVRPEINLQLTLVL